MAELRPVCPNQPNHVFGVRPDVTVHTHRSGGTRWVFYRCTGCGREWTGHERAADRSEPVSGDEVLDVHERLAGWDGSLNELLEAPKQ